jgi:hypothetical protein
MKNVTLLVNSFDGYSVCWPVFAHGLRKYWPTHPEQVRFITNHLDVNYGEAIKVGPDRGWSANLLFALQRIDTPFVLYAQEDYWIDQPVDQEMMDAYLRLFEEEKADYLRLYPAPPPNRPLPEDERLGIIAVGAPYRTSTQMAFWRRQVLCDLLDPAESGWQYEVQSVPRSAKYGDRFLCVSKRRYGISYVFTAVVSGEFIPEARQYARQEGIELNVRGLPPKTLVRKWKGRVRQSLSRLKKRLRASG